MRNVMIRLQRELKRAYRNNNRELIRVLTIVRDGSMYGSKHAPIENIKGYYLGKGSINEQENG